MKHKILFLFFFSSVNMLSAQKSSVSVDKNNFFYVGLDNPITVTVENCSCNSLRVKTSNGKIIGSGCSYIYRIDTSIVKNLSNWYTYIIVSKKMKGKTQNLSKFFFRLKSVPDPFPKVGNSIKDNISLEELKNTRLLKAEMESFDYSINFKVNSFTVSAIRSDSKLCNEINNLGNRFNEETILLINQLKKNDIIIFDNIFVNGEDGSLRHLKPLSLMVL